MMVTKVLLLCGCTASDTIAPTHTGSNANMYNTVEITEVSYKQDSWVVEPIEHMSIISYVKSLLINLLKL